MNLAAINRLRDLSYIDLLATAAKLGVDLDAYDQRRLRPKTHDALRLAIIDKIVAQELKAQKEGSTK